MFLDSFPATHFCPNQTLHSDLARSYVPLCDLLWVQKPTKSKGEGTLHLACFITTVSNCHSQEFVHFFLKTFSDDVAPSPYSILPAAVQPSHYKGSPLTEGRTSCCSCSHWLLILATKNRPSLSKLLPFVDLRTFMFSMSSLSWSSLFRFFQSFLTGHIFLTSCHFLSSLQPFLCFLEARRTKLDGGTFKGDTVLLVHPVFYKLSFCLYL